MALKGWGGNCLVITAASLAAIGLLTVISMAEQLVCGNVGRGIDVVVKQHSEAHLHKRVAFCILFTGLLTPLLNAVQDGLVFGWRPLILLYTLCLQTTARGYK